MEVVPREVTIFTKYMVEVGDHTEGLWGYFGVSLEGSGAILEA